MIITVHIAKISKKSIITEHIANISNVEVTMKYAYYVQESLGWSISV